MSSLFSAVLLAGGKSTRMGRDKAFVCIDGVPLWQRQLHLLQQLQPLEIFLAGPSRLEWNDAGCTIVSDARENCGPLGALVAALRLCSTKLLVTLAVDLPQITLPHLQLLQGLCSEERGVIPLLKKFEPLAAIYPRRALAIAEAHLSSGRFALQDFAARCVAEDLVSLHRVPFSETPLYLNMNTPDDLPTATR